MKHLIFGTGKILIERGSSGTGSAEPSKYIFLTEQNKERPVGSHNGHASDSVRPAVLEDHDVVLEFKSMASARVLADKLNLLVCLWDEESSVSAP